MEENLIIIKHKSIKSVFSLTSRTFILQLINFFSGYLFATIYLNRFQFGTFIIISAIIDILGYFSDVGLAAALVQKRKTPSIKEIRSTFTMQQILVTLIIFILMFFSPLIKKAYHLDFQGMLLLYCFALAFFFSSLKTIPSVLLERKIEFTKLIIPQFVETIIYNFTLVFMLWKGYGLQSYSVAVLARGFLGMITLYFIAPWPIGFSFSFKILKKLFHFGLPFQLNSLLAVVKDKMMILILGSIIGSEGIGILGWAEKQATLPLRYFLDNTVKVGFSTFSRLQHHKEKLRIAIEKSFYFLSFILFPTLAGIGIISPMLVKIIPNWLQWRVGLIPLYIYCLASVFGSLAVFVTTIFNSIGKITTTFKLMIFWTIISCLIIPLLAWKLGIIGASLGILIVNASSIIGILILNRWVSVNYFKLLKGPTVSVLIMLLVTGYLKQFLPLTVIGLISLILIGFFTYLISFYLVDKKKLMQEILLLKTYFVNKL